MTITGKAAAFCPAHITGFFYICDQGEDPLASGSLGAGFSLVAGVTTRIATAGQAGPAEGIFIDGQKTNRAVVSGLVIKLFFSGIKAKPIALNVSHTLGIPMGAGFGSSGAAALSLAFALNALFASPLSEVEAAQIAHRAEVECQTGLGTVIAESVGGLEVRKRAGAPGIGEIVVVPVPEATTALCLSFGGLSTAKALGDAVIRKKINALGEKLTAEFLKTPSIETFLSCSRRFAEYTGLITGRVAEVLRLLDALHIPCSMPMFGEGIFTLVDQEQAARVLNVFAVYKDRARIIECSIDLQGGRIIHDA